MPSSICTLFEGHYHYGVGAMANSLYRNGYRGDIWVGYRGALPPWVGQTLAEERCSKVEVTAGLTLCFVPLNTDRHLTNFKAEFMQQLFAEQPEISGLFYVDPDITIRCEWSFFERWIGHGIALIQDITNGTMPADHPLRKEWIPFAASLGLIVRRDLSQYFNAGFLGVRREYQSCLENWRVALDALPAKGIDLSRFMGADRMNAFCATDQDMLNLMAMVTEHPISTIGPEGMDFVPGGFTMSHPVGNPKPWRKVMMVSALKGFRPSPGDHGYLQNAEGPIRLYTAGQLLWRKIDLLCGAAIGRLWNRA